MADIGGILLGEFTSFLSGRVATETLFRDFVNDRLNHANVTVFGSDTTLLYSGNYNTAPAFKMAISLAEQSGGKVAILDNTNMGRFLLYALSNSGSSQLGFEPTNIFKNEMFDLASAKFVGEARGNIVTMTSTSILDSTWNRAEVDAIMGNSKITHVNGVDLAPFREQWTKLNSDTARHAYAKIFFERTFAQAVSEGAGNAVFGDTTAAVMQLDSATQQKLGLPLFNSNTGTLPQVLDNKGLQDKLFTPYARGLAGEAQMQALLDTPDRAVAAIGADAASASAEFQGETNKIVEILKKMRDLGKLSGISDFVGLMRVYLATNGADITLAVDVIQQHAGLIKEALKDAPSAIKDAALKYLKVFENFWTAEEGLVIPEIEAAAALRVAGVVGAALLGLVEVQVQYKKNGGFTAGFWQWAGDAAKTAAIALPVGAGAIWAAGLVPGGQIVLIGLGAVGTYVAVRHVAEEVIQVYADEPNSYMYKGAEFVLYVMHGLESYIAPVIEMAIEALKPIGAAALEFVDILTKAVPNIQVVSEQGAAIVLEKGQWLVGRDAASLFGSADSDLLLHTGAGEVRGLAGDDTLIGWQPTVIHKGEKIGDAPPAGKPDTRSVADHDMSLTLDGGAGDDWVIAVGGAGDADAKGTVYSGAFDDNKIGTVTIGGAGRDWIYNTSQHGVIFGDTVDGLDPLTHQSIMEEQKTNANNARHDFSDNIWWSGSSTVMDADHYDHLKFFGLPLVGGDTSGGLALQMLGGAVAGLAGVAIGAAQTFTPARDAYYFDTLFSFMIYKMDYTHGRHDMLVVNELQQLLFSAYGGGAPNVDFGVMRIKNFDFVGSYTGFQQLELTNTSDNELEAQGLKGTMGMVFKKAMISDADILLRAAVPC